MYNSDYHESSVIIYHFFKEMVLENFRILFCDSITKL